MVCDFRALISPHIQICRSTVGIMSLRFNSDGTFRVLQMADIQDGPDVREDTIRLIEAAIKKAHPDLIVLTGDQIRGYDPAYIDTFLRRRGEQPGTHVRAVTEIEAKIRALLLAPTAANFFWNKGGWIQNRANTLAIWCMFAQVFPMFQDESKFAVQSVNNPNVNLTVSIIALVANVLALGYILYRAKKQHVNPWLQEVFKGTRDYEQAIARQKVAA